jgi:hypothetical protein
MNHAKILRAYIASIPPAQLAAIVKAEERAWQAAMNEGSRSQIAAGERVDEAIAAAVAAIIPHDVAKIERVICSIAPEIVV